MPLLRAEDGDVDDFLGANQQEASALLSSTSLSRESPDPQPISPQSRFPCSINTHQRQSSFSKKGINGSSRVPRTPNRVRFSFPEPAEQNSGIELQDQQRRDASPEWLDNEDYFSHANGGTRRSSTGQRAPLLTGIEAPSVRVAAEAFEGNIDQEIYQSRPKSGVRGAFMNMANSIM